MMMRTCSNQSCMFTIQTRVHARARHTQGTHTHTHTSHMSHTYKQSHRNTQARTHTSKYARTRLHATNLKIRHGTFRGHDRRCSNLQLAPIAAVQKFIHRQGIIFCFRRARSCKPCVSCVSKSCKPCASCASNSAYRARAIGPCLPYVHRTRLCACTHTHTHTNTNTHTHTHTHTQTLSRFSLSLPPSPSLPPALTLLSRSLARSLSLSPSQPSFIHCD